jgi:hypothetical protein
MSQGFADRRNQRRQAFGYSLGISGKIKDE